MLIGETWERGLYMIVVAESDEILWWSGQSYESCRGKVSVIRDTKSRSCSACGCNRLGGAKVRRHSALR
jgi:hypothetical protein